MGKKNNPNQNRQKQLRNIKAKQKRKAHGKQNRKAHGKQKRKTHAFKRINELFTDPLQAPIRRAKNPDGPYGLTGLGPHAPQIGNDPGRFTREHTSDFGDWIFDEHSSHIDENTSFRGGDKQTKKTYMISNMIFHFLR